MTVLLTLTRSCALVKCCNVEVLAELTKWLHVLFCVFLGGAGGPRLPGMSPSWISHIARSCERLVNSVMGEALPQCQPQYANGVHKAAPVLGPPNATPTV